MSTRRSRPAPAGRGFRPGRDGHLVNGRLGQPVDQLGVVLEGQGPGAEPAPGAGQGGFDLDRNWPRLPVCPASPAAPSAG